MTLITDVSLTSDKDYLKIHTDGLMLLSANGTPDGDSTFPSDPSGPFGFASSTVLNHPLLTVPLVRAFWDPNKNGQWINSRYSYTDPWLKVIATTTYVKFIMNTDGAAKTDIPVFYRLYNVSDKSIDSDARIDKIFKKEKLTIIANPGDPFTPTFTTQTAPHNEGEVPLWSLQFSEDNINWYPEGMQIIGPPDTTSGPPGGPYSRFFYTSAFGRADNQNFYIILESGYTTAKTIYVRYALDYRK